MRALARVAGAFVLAAGAAHAAGDGEGDAGPMAVALAQAGEWTPPAGTDAPDGEAPPSTPAEDPGQRVSRQQTPSAQPKPSPRKQPPSAAPPQPSPLQAPSPQSPSPQAPSPQPPAAQAPSPQPPCPPPQPGAATAPVPGGTISGSSICGATIIGGTISGATIIGGTISGGAISGGSISQSNISGPKDAAPQAPPGKSPADAQAATPQTGAPGADPQAPTQPAGPAKPQARSAPAAREGRTGASPRRPGQKRDPAADGSGEDDEEDEEDLAARALERALVQRGALLLPVWGFEISPAFSYGHTSQDTFAVIASESAPPTTVGLRKRTHQMTGSLTARLGLPLDLQIEAAIPATLALSNVTVAGAASNDASGFGVGDPRISLTWQVLRAGDVAPDILLAANWKPRLGSSPFDASSGSVGLGAGYDAVGGTVTAVKSADPLVLLANASYTANLAAGTKQGRRDPGNSFGLGGGAILAVSPDTSLSFLLDFRYKPDDTLDGKAVLGSDETVAVLQLGLGRVLSRRVLLNVTAAIGLTSDSPTFQLGLSMPVRF